MDNLTIITAILIMLKHKNMIRLGLEHPDMVSIADNINRLMIQEGISASDLSRKIGIDRSVLHKILNGSTKNPTLGSIKALINYYSYEEIVLGNCESLSDTMVPIVSWSEICFLRHPIDRAKYKHIKLGRNVSQNTFALIIEHSLDIRFPVGTILIIEREKEPKNLSYVIVKEQDNLLPSMKRYVLDGSIAYLKSLDPTFPSIKYDPYITAINGVVVQSLFDFE